MSTVTLPVSRTTPQGVYNLSVGLYDAQVGGRRAPLFAVDGQELTDAQAVLTSITVQ